MSRLYHMMLLQLMPNQNSFGSSDMNAPNLGGTWKLRFTTATDATFKPGKRGPATTLQYVNTTIGTFTNIVEFRENTGKVKGFQVVVEGEPVNDKRINLTFRKVIIDRRSRIGLNRIVIPIPNFNFLSKILNRRRKVEEDVNTTKKKREGPHFNMLYLDDEMRIHKTGDGNFFVQTRLYDAWDPMKGWTLISAV
jgi:PAP_fibrillin